MVIFKRTATNLMQKCLDCQHLKEVKDDAKRYSKTRAVICNAPHSVYKNCFEYRWLFVQGTIRGYEPEPQEEPERLGTVDAQKMHEILTKLKKTGKK